MRLTSAPDLISGRVWIQQVMPLHALVRVRGAVREGRGPIKLIRTIPGFRKTPPHLLRRVLTGTIFPAACGMEQVHLTVPWYQNQREPIPATLVLAMRRPLSPVPLMSAPALNVFMPAAYQVASGLLCLSVPDTTGSRVH